MGGADRPAPARSGGPGPYAPRVREEVILGDNLDVLADFPDGAFQLVYADPPFNTGRTQTRRTLATVAAQNGDRTGFKGRRYRTEVKATSSYADRFGDYVAWLAPRLEALHRVLAPTGTLYFHIDYREAHYCKVFLDELFGRECFLNELIWAYDYGARATKRWPAKHDPILVSAKDPGRYPFDPPEVAREPSTAPGLCAPRTA